MGTSGIGSDDHLAMLAFQRAAGVEMTHVPFKGAADVRTALVGGHIMVGAMNIGEAMVAQASGAPIRQLGQMSQSAARSRRTCRPSRSRATTSSSTRCAAPPRPRAAGPVRERL